MPLTRCLALLLWRALAPLAAAAMAGLSQAQPAEPLALGVLPNVSARLIITSYQPMREYLERELKRPVEVVTAPDFRSFSERTFKGEYQLVVTAPNLGRVAQLDAGWEPLAIYEPRISALLVGSADNPNDAPEQVRGKAVALANPQSLVAFVGLQWLRTQGLQPGSDFKVVVTANDDSLGAVIRSGEAPWAIMSMGEFRAKPESLRKTLRIVTEMAKVPGFLVMVNPRMSPAEKQRVKALLLAFPATEDGKRFFGLSGFANIREVADADLSFLDPFNEQTRKGLGLRP
jgi:phosphonate transport system substrate-binding protein